MVIVVVDVDDDDDDEAPSFFPSPLFLLPPLVVVPVLVLVLVVVPDPWERGWKASQVASTVTAPPTYHRNVNTWLLPVAVVVAVMVSEACRVVVVVLSVDSVC